MALNIIPLLFSYLLFSSNFALAQTARPEDVSSIEGMMKTYYEVVSGPANTPRDIARDLSLHHPKAQIFPLMHDKNGARTPRIFHQRIS